MTDQQTSQTNITEVLRDEQRYSSALSDALLRMGHHSIGKHQAPTQYDSDSALACPYPQCLDALAAEPRSDAVTAPDEPSHPEERCQRCSRPNVWSWHAPSPLWNAVMRQPDGSDLYGIVCPPCFAELAGESGVLEGAEVWHFAPEGVDIAALWDDAEGRVWDAALCLWVEREARAAPASVPPLDVERLPLGARLTLQRGDDYGSGAPWYAIVENTIELPGQDTGRLGSGLTAREAFDDAVRAYAAETPEQGRGDE